jgi:hypothetical protein
LILLTNDQRCRGSLRYDAQLWSPRRRLKRLRASEAAIAAGRLDALASEATEGAAALGQAGAAERPAIAISIGRSGGGAASRCRQVDPGAARYPALILSSFELWNRIETASATSIPLARFTEAATVDALAELLCALVDETLRAKSGASSPAQATGPDEELQEQTMALLPRQRWAVAMRGARMTSDHGRCWKQAGVTIEPAIDDGALVAAGCGRATAYAADGGRQCRRGGLRNCRGAPVR